MTKADQSRFDGVTLGIDFGTTNTVLSVAAPDGTTVVLSVPKDGVDIYRLPLDPLLLARSRNRREHR